MAFLLTPDIVRYACSCGSYKPMSKIYFCRHCMKIRCGFCVCHEVDSHFCANCMENLPSAEARVKKNRCSNCLDCPCCFHSLSTRALVTPVPASGDQPSKKPTSKKTYYLACAFCRWTSRDVGLTDRNIATGDWPDSENPYASRVSTLLEHYKILALLERKEKEKKKQFVPSRSFHNFSGLSSIMARKRAGLPPLSGILPKGDVPAYSECAPSVAADMVEGLPEDLFFKQVDMLKTTTLQQRFMDPERQPEVVTDMIPVHKQLLIKRSLRCRTCEHNVSKPEFNPGSIKFKIQLAAFYHLPEVRIITCEPLRKGQSSNLIIKLCNPTPHQMTITFHALPSVQEEMARILKEKEAKKTKHALEKLESEQQKHLSGREELSLRLSPSLSRQVSVSEEPRVPKVVLSGEVTLPESNVILPPRDDAAEFDDSFDNHGIKDDPRVVVWRKANKAAVKLPVVPIESDSLNLGDLVKVGFMIEYSYVNTITALDSKEPQKAYLQAKVVLKIGKLVGNE